MVLLSVWIVFFKRDFDWICWQQQQYLLSTNIVKYYLFYASIQLANQYCSLKIGVVFDSGTFMKRKTFVKHDEIFNFVTTVITYLVSEYVFLLSI